MLYVPGNHFNWSVDNFGTSYSDAALGTSIPGNASVNVKGANTNVLNGIAEDCYGISICFCGGNASATIRRHLVDLIVDYGAGVGNAGATWTVLIANLYANSPCLGTNGCWGYWYYFPVFIPKGAAVGFANQSLTAAGAIRAAIRLLGKPTRPELVKFGTKVQTIGATTATTTGVAITPGTSTQGTFTGSMGTLSLPSWWFQLGIGSADSTMTGASYYFDLVADLTSPRGLMQVMPYAVCQLSEQAMKGAVGQQWTRTIEAGAALSARGSCAGTPDSSMTVIAYAVA